MLLNPNPPSVLVSISTRPRASRHPVTSTNAINNVFLHHRIVLSPALSTLHCYCLSTCLGRSVFIPCCPQCFQCKPTLSAAPLNPPQIYVLFILAPFADITRYQPPRRSSDGSDSTIELERVIPAGQPYLTKVNGKLVMAREKKPKATTVAIDLLGEALGQKTRIIRKRSKSLDKPNGPLIIGGVTYVPQQQIPAPYTTPIPQQAFSTQNLMHYPPQPTFVLPNPSQQSLNQLHQMQAHFGKMYGPGAPNNPQNGKVEVTSTTITITKHICAGCGRIRSKRYHHDHPIKQGEKPEPDFCRKCQKDTSSTDSEGESQDVKKKTKKAKHKKHNVRLSLIFKDLVADHEWQKHVKHSSDDEESDSPQTHTKSKRSAKVGCLDNLSLGRV